jgi:hypothetical protein
VTIQLPDFGKVWEYENNFYLSCDMTRVSKILAHWDLFRMTSHLTGAIVECGVFKGASLLRFATFRDPLRAQIAGPNRNTRSRSACYNAEPGDLSEPAPATEIVGPGLRSWSGEIEESAVDAVWA